MVKVPLEKEIEKPVVTWARKKMGLQVIKLNAIGQRSMPDRLFWIPGGKPFMIEFKRPGKHATPLQQHTIDELRNIGYDVEVHDNVDEAKGAIEKRLSQVGKVPVSNSRGVETPPVPEEGDKVPTHPRRRRSTP